MKLLYQSKIRYKGVTMSQFMDLLIDTYQVTLEREADRTKIIEAPWDPNQHIKILYKSLKTNLETPTNMKNDISYLSENFIKAGYIVIRQSNKKIYEIV